MIAVTTCVLGVLAACAAYQAEQAPAQPGKTPLLTVAERSDYKATSRYEDVRAFAKELSERSKYVRIGDIGKTHEGREIPLVIVADPPVATPEDAAKAIKKDGRLVILMFGNIHAGEVDGKEGLMALMRDVALGREVEAERQKGEGTTPPSAPPSLLDHLILCFVPIYNADGNERFSKDNRPGQDGPEEGQGIRENAQGFDLNRDFVKLEAPETRALIRCITRWDPAIIVDAHTTNGSYHRYPMTYGGPKNPAGDARIIEFARTRLFPGVATAVKQGRGLDTWYYGNFNRDKTRWEQYPDQLRYGTNTFGVRNRIGILTESYSYAPYKVRVIAQYDYIRALLDFAAGSKDDIAKLVREADEATVNAGKEPKADDVVALRARVAPFDENVTVAGWVEEERDGRAHPTDQPKDFEVEHHGNYIADLTVPRPAAYIIPADPTFRSVVENLQRHGVEVEELREDLEVPIEVYAIDTVTKAVRPFQGHDTLTVEATSRPETRTIAAGSFVVRTGQKLGSLAVCLLEPESSDGLATWNFFDAALDPGKDFPILRVPAPTAMLTLPALALTEDQPKEKKRLTFELLYESDERINFSGSPTGVQRWIDDEYFVQSKEGKVWKVHARTGRAEPMDAELKPIEEALSHLPTIGEKQAKALAERHGQRGSSERDGFFFDHENDLYYCRFDGAAAARLTSSPQREEYPTFSPDGEFVAYLRDNDLWVVDVDTQSERALTSGGTDTVRNGKAGWVYFEELYNRNWRLYWWSPDSARIAYIRVDSTPEKRFTIVNNVPGQQVVEVAPYPRPGEPNPRATVHVVSVAGGDPRNADLSPYDAEAMLVTGVGWWPDSSSFYAFVQNRTQTWLDMLSFPADGGEGRKLFRETTEAWVDTPPAPEFLKDGSFVILSERTGWKHAFHYARDGTLTKQVTDGEWDIRSISKVIEDQGGVVFFSGTKDSPIASNTYRVNLDGSGLARLTPERGSHQASLSTSGRLLADSWSTIDTPTRVVLREATDGAAVRTLDTNPVRALDQYILVKPELVQIPTPDGFTLEGVIHLPPDLDESRKCPVWFQTYGGPSSPTVSDAWQGGRTWEQMLAQAGFIAYRSDPRSASGKGAVSAWTAYKQLGAPELADIETAIRWLSQRPYADASRVGMSGHSYGGFMTAFALTHSDLFAAGIAGAPVTDWRDYDTIYTERFMLTPQENPDGYEKTSVVKAAENVHGRLLLIHGMMDDNVHLANNTKLIHALQRANKPFEMMLYPESRHGIGGKHYQRVQYDFITKTLGEPAPSDSLGEKAAETQQGP